MKAAVAGRAVVRTRRWRCGSACLRGRVGTLGCLGVLVVELLDLGVAFVAVLTMVSLGVSYHLSTRLLDLRGAVMQLATAMDDYSSRSADTLDDTIGAITSSIGAEIEGTLTGVFDQMHVPTAADHISGGLVQLGTMWLQNRIMKDMPEGMMGMLQAQSEQPEG